LAQTPSPSSTSAPTATTKTQTGGARVQQQMTTNLQNSGLLTYRQT
jgi:hypothetical protein